MNQPLCKNMCISALHHPFIKSLKDHPRHQKTAPIDMLELNPLYSFIQFIHSTTGRSQRPTVGVRKRFKTCESLILTSNSFEQSRSEQLKFLETVSEK